MIMGKMSVHNTRLKPGEFELVCKFVIKSWWVFQKTFQNASQQGYLRKVQLAAELLGEWVVSKSCTLRQKEVWCIA